MRLFNHEALKQRRRSLRANLTPAEATLWRALKGSTLGHKFRRQHSVDRYVLDFYCPSAKLAIELDGAGHDNETIAARDEERDAYLAGLGIAVLRIENKHVRMSLEGVLALISEAIARRPTTPGRARSRSRSA